MRVVIIYSYATSFFSILLLSYILHHILLLRYTFSVILLLLYSCVIFVMLYLAKRNYCVTLSLFYFIFIFGVVIAFLSLYITLATLKNTKVLVALSFI